MRYKIKKFLILLFILINGVLYSADLNQTIINENNVTQTCRKCHKDATEIFAKSYTHEFEAKDAQSINEIVKSIYFWLIILVIGGMAAHNFLIFIFEIRQKRKNK